MHQLLSILVWAYLLLKLLSSYVRKLFSKLHSPALCYGFFQPGNYGGTNALVECYIRRGCRSANASIMSDLDLQQSLGVPIGNHLQLLTGQQAACFRLLEPLLALLVGLKG